MSDEIAKCPCGATPNKLLIGGVERGGKWAQIGGDCCGEWEISFRTGYEALDSDECMAFGLAAWNGATRAKDAA